MAKYVAYAEFGGDSTHHSDRSNLCLIETGNPHVQLTVNKVGGTNGRITHNERVTVTGTVKDQRGRPINNYHVVLWVLLPRDTTGHFSTDTDRNGKFTMSFNPTRHGDYIIYCVCPKTDLYAETKSDEQYLTTNNLDTSTSLTANYNSLIVDQTVTLTATVTDSENNVIKGVTVAFYDSENNLLGTRISNTSGKASLSQKLTEVKTYRYYAKSIATGTYAESPNSDNVTVTTRKHDLTAEIEATTLYLGWTARIHVQNESLLTTKNAKFKVTINNNVQNIFSDNEGVIETPAFNTVGSSTIKVEFAGNSKYNILSKTFNVTVKGAVTVRRVPQGIVNDNENAPYRSWTNLTGILAGSEGSLANCGTACTPTAALAGRNGTANTPAPLKFTRWGFGVPSDAELTQLKVFLSIKTLSCSSDSANIGISAPTWQIFGKQILMDLPTSNGLLPYKSFGLVTATLPINHNIDTHTVNNNETPFYIKFPKNTTTNIGRVQIDVCYIELTYLPKQIITGGS